MKHLFLIRHAKSSWSNPGLSDFERPLNKRGKRDAPFMGKRLATIDPRPDCIISSPARRARKTARAVGAEIGFSKKDIILEDELYTFSAHTIIEILKRTSDSIQTLALVGHNHGITECGEYLSGERLDNVPTCGIVLIQFDCKRWAHIGPQSGSLLLFDYPKLHADSGSSI
jgi:phosphohistidine phosphatase